MAEPDLDTRTTEERQAEIAEIARLDRSILMVERIVEGHNVPGLTTLDDVHSSFGGRTLRELARFYVGEVLNHSPTTVVVASNDWLNYLDVPHNANLVAYYLYRARVEPINAEVEEAHAALWRWFDENEARLSRPD